MSRIGVQPYKKVLLPTKEDRKSAAQFVMSKMTLQTMIIHALGFLLGRVVVLGGISPFGIAYYAVCHYEGVNSYGIAIALVLGMLTVNNPVNLLKYTAAVAIILAINRYKRKKNTERRAGVQAAIGAGSIVVVGLAAAVISGITVYGSMIAVLEGILVFTLGCIYDKCMPIFFRSMKRKILSSEEVISISILFSGVIAGVADIGVYGIYIRDVLSILIILVLGYRGGLAVGTSVGVVVGLILMIAGYAPATIVGVLSVSGMISGLLRDLGRAGSGIGFFLGSTILTLYFDRNIVNMEYFIPMSIGIVIFMLLPKKLFDKINTIVTCDRTAQEEEYLSRVRDITADKLQGFSRSFYKLSRTFSNLSEKKTGLNQKEVSKLIDDVAARVCKDCGLCVHCWEHDFYNTYQTVFSILAAAEKKGKIDLDDIPRDFIGKCVRLERFVDTTNRVFDLYKYNLIWHNRIVESRELVSEQLMGVASIIGNLATDIHMEIQFKEDLEEAIKVELDRNRIGVNSVIVLENKYGKYEVTLSHKSCYGRRNCVRDMIPIVNKVLGKKMKQSHNTCSVSKEQNNCTLKLIEEQKYRITTGAARATKHNHSVSGDTYSYMELKDGQCMMALSDGMGSGNKANMESAAAIDLLEQFMESGFEKDTAVKMINSVLVLKSSEESFSTLDMCVVDLYTGVSEFVKIGAAATFLKREDMVDVIKSTSLPVGMLNKVDIELTKKKLKDGDIVVMITDGVIDSLEEMVQKEKWIESALLQIRSNNPQDIADYLLQEAKNNVKGDIQDDMTVLAARIWEKY